MQYEIDLNENIEDLVLNAPKVFYFKTQIASVTVFHATERCSVKWIFFTIIVHITFHHYLRAIFTIENNF